MKTAGSRFVGLTLALLFLAAAGHAAAALPGKPQRYFNDYAGLVSSTVGANLDRKLEQFERDSSNQIIVAIYPKLDYRGAVADYTVKAAESWGIGQKGRNNGAVLFVFVQNREMRIEVGYGLEGAIPDAVAHTIIENELKPRFRAGNYAGGLTAGINALIAASRNEYRGTGATVNESRTAVANAGSSRSNFPRIGLFILLFIIISLLNRRRRSVYGNPARRFGGGLPWIITSSRGSGRSGGGFGGGFSGGGGHFGGGGAGGRW